MEYKPSRKDIAYIADIDDKKLENWLTRGVVKVDDLVPSARWRRFSFADGLKIAFVHELTKYGMVADLANVLTYNLLEFKVNLAYWSKQVQDQDRLETMMIQDPATGKLFTLPEMTDDEAAQFLEIMAAHRWVIRCELERRGPDLVETYKENLVYGDEPVPRDWSSYIVIHCRAIIDGVLTRWQEIISRKQKENK